MTKKDYILLARALAESKPEKLDKTPSFLVTELVQWEKDVRSIAQALSNQNGSFNFGTFYAACGLELVKK